MPSRILPNLGLKGFYNPGENGWGADMSASLLKLSVLVQGGVKSRVAAVPGAPADGDVHVLTAGPNAQNVAVYDAAAWVYYVPSEGWLLYDRDADKYITFDGAAWTELATGTGDGGTDPGGGGETGGSLHGAHRYWSIYATSNNGGYVAYAEIEMLDVPAGTNQCVGGTASATGGDNQGVPADAFDGDKTNVYCHFGGPPKRIVYDFGVGEAVEVAQVNLTSRTSTATDIPTAFRIEYSDDGAAWTTAWEVAGSNGWVSGETRGFVDPTYTVPVPGGGSASFPSFVGNAGKALIVNEDEDGVEWAEIMGGGGGSASGWEVVAKWDGATDPDVDFLVASVVGYTDLILSFDRVQANNANRRVTFSSDGGATWITGDNYHTDLGASGGVAYNDGAAYQSGSSNFGSMHYLVSGIDAEDGPKLMLGNRNIFFTGYAPITNVSLNCEGASSGRMTILGKKAVAAGGGSGGSPVSTRPRIVQMVKGRTKNASGDLTFPYELTPGNMVVILYASAASPGHLVPEGFQTIGYSSNDGAIEGHYRPGVGNKYQAGYAAVRRVIPGDQRNIFVQAGGDVNNWLLLEITDADMVDFQAVRMQKDDNTHFRTTRMRLPFDSLDLFFLEHDDVGALVPDVGVVLETFSGGGDNHAGVVVDASDVDGDLTGTVASSVLNFPVAYRLSVAKYQGAATRGGGGGSGAPWYFDPPKVADFPEAFGPEAANVVKTDDADVGLILTRTGASYKRAGLGKAVPAGNWTATCRIEANLLMTGGSAAGASLIVSNPAKDKYFEWGHDNRNYMEMARFNNDGYDGWEHSIGVPGAFPPFFRFVYDAASGNVSYQFSQHGKVFTEAGVRNIKADFGGNDPGFIGLALRTESYQWAVSAAFAMFTVE